MENLVLVAHVIIALVIIGLIMLQQGKGAEMGASFGSGSSQTVFGAAGSGSFFSRLTTIFAAIFFVTSFSLAILAKNNSSIETEGFVLPDAVEEVADPLEASVSNADPEAALEEAESALEGAAKAIESAASDALEASGVNESDASASDGVAPQ